MAYFAPALTRPIWQNKNPEPLTLTVSPEKRILFNEMHLGSVLKHRGSFSVLVNNDEESVAIMGSTFLQDIPFDNAHFYYDRGHHRNFSWLSVMGKFETDTVADGYVSKLELLKTSRLSLYERVLVAVIGKLHDAAEFIGLGKVLPAPPRLPEAMVKAIGYGINKGIYKENGYSPLSGLDTLELYNQLYETFDIEGFTLVPVYGSTPEVLVTQFVHGKGFNHVMAELFDKQPDKMIQLLGMLREELSLLSSEARSVLVSYLTRYGYSEICEMKPILEDFEVALYSEKDDASIVFDVDIMPKEEGVESYLSWMVDETFKPKVLLRHLEKSRFKTALKYLKEHMVCISPLSGLSYKGNMLDHVMPLERFVKVFPVYEGS